MELSALGGNGLPASLVDLLWSRASTHHDQVAYTFLRDEDGAEDQMTYGELARRARAVAALLQERGASGQRVLILFPSGLDYVAAFFGCLAAGAVAVPAYPPRPNRPMPRIEAILANCQPAVALTTRGILAQVEGQLAACPALGSLHWLATDAIELDAAGGYRPVHLTADRLAFLQYTSGSTGNPKGVMVSHGNLLHNLALMRQGLMMPDDARWVTWLPMYHDMGLIGGILEPLYMGGSSVLLSPAAFLQRPICWLQAITRYRGTISGAPNFAYELCVDKTTPDQRASLDLSSWRLAVCAAEPVRRETLLRFAATFTPVGFSRRAFYPGYGLAEGTLQVTGGYGPGEPVSLDLCRDELARGSVKLLEAGPDADVIDADQRGAPRGEVDRPGDADGHGNGGLRHAQNFVGCGRVRLDQQVLIAHPESRTRCRSDEIGEIWVAGPSVAQGYWNSPELTAETFRAELADTGDGPFLRTGDLGFFLAGELYVTGRLKDLIIIRGRNHYPQDIELSAERAHPALRPTGGAAFAVTVEREEQLVLVHELDRQQRDADPGEVIGAIRRAVVEEHEVSPFAVVLIKPYSIPKTSSGKIQRQACRQAYLEGRLEVLAAVAGRPGAIAEPLASNGCPASTRSREPIAGLETSSLRSQAPGLSQAPSRTAGQIQQWLVANLATRLHVSPAEVDLRQPFNTLGLDSLQMVGLIGDLETWLGRKLTATMAWDYPTILLLSRHLATDGGHSRGSSGEPAVAAEPIAVVGMACRFPGAADLDSYWRLMAEGRDAIGEIPADRWSAADFYDANPDAPGKMATRWGGFLGEIDRFDPRLFNITPREAARMDPQQRLLLEVAWEAFEHAGLGGEQIAGSRTGVFVGIGGTDYSQMYRGFDDYLRYIDAYCGTGNALSIAANRLSYVFDLHGPSLSIDTACSSALVSLHFAVQSLRGRECDMALAGGVNVILSPETTIAFSKARMLSPDGKCRPFDAAANGYVRGEGCGLVVLKRLGDAIRSGDNILAVLRGTAVNQDGKSSGLTAPNGPAQQECIRRALAQADVAPEQLTYVEAHGTGTPLGDPIEASALQAVLGQRSPGSPACYMGSVKANIGHLETASGIAGLIRVILMLKHEAIPPQRNFETLNPNIPVLPHGLQISRELRPWPAGAAARLASISGFGFGGTNAHVVIEESPIHSPTLGAYASGSPDGGALKLPPASLPPHAGVKPSLHLATLSAQSEVALKELAARHAKYLAEHPDVALADVCHTLNAGRTHLAERVAVVAESVGQLADRLASIATAGKAAGAARGTAARGTAPKVAFLFTGQGSQYFGMARALYETQPHFRRTLELCDEILRPLIDRPLLTVLYDPDAAGLVDQTVYTQPALFAVEYALARLWESWGVRPDALLGHSVGEYPAACLAGVFSLEDGLRLIAQRARRMQQLPGHGQMAAILASQSEVAPVVASFGGRLAIAAVNGPDNVVVSGCARAVEQIVHQFQDRDVPCQSLTVSHAFHSAQLDPMLDGFEAFAREIEFHAPERLLISNRTGRPFAAGEVPSASYWREHSRHCVQFDRGVAALVEAGCEVFLEVGPAPVLLGLAKKCAPADFGAWLPTLRRGQDDWRVVLSSLAALYTRGVPIDWAEFERPFSRTRLALPTYPFERQRHWMEPHEGAGGGRGGPTPTGGAAGWCAAATGKHPLLGMQLPSAIAMTQFLADINLRRLPYLAEHKVHGSVVFPGAGYIELGLAAAQQVFGPGQHGVENVNFQQVLLLDERPHPVQVVVSPEVAGRCAFQVFHLPGAAAPGDGGEASQASSQSAAIASPGAWVLHAEGVLRRGLASDDLPAEQTEAWDRLAAGLDEALDRTESNRRLAARGLDYGPAFQWSQCTWRSDGQAVTQFVVPPSLAATLDAYQVHPGLLDTCIQTIGATVPPDWAPPGSGQTYLPVGVRRLRVLAAPRGALWGQARTRLPTAAEDRELVEGDLVLYNEAGRPVLELNGVQLRRVGRSLNDAEADVRQWFYIPQWQLAGELPTQEVALDAIVEPHLPGRNGAAHSVCGRDERHHAGALSANGFASKGSASRGSAPNGTVSQASNGHANGRASGHAKVPAAASNGHPQPATGGWLLLADASGFAERLAQRLKRRGQRVDCVQVDALATAGPNDFRELLAKTFPGARPECCGIVHLWSLDLAAWEASADAPNSAASLSAAYDATEHLGCESVLHLVQAVAHLAWASPPRLVLVTRGALQVEDPPREQLTSRARQEASAAMLGLPGERSLTVAARSTGMSFAGIAQSALSGLASVISVEHPELGCTLVDLDPAVPLDQDERGLAGLVAELLPADDGDPRDPAGRTAARSAQQLAYRAGQRYVPRLVRLPVDAEPAAEEARGEAPLTVPKQDPFRLEFTSPGSLNRLTLRPFRRSAPRAGEVEIEVGAAGLNFSDVLKAMGLYPGAGSGPVPMGIECAGRVAAVGPEVAGLDVGQAVIAVAPFSFASHALTQAWAVVPKPDHLSDAEAATLPIAFLTAWYALYRLAQVEPGERVLIHAAAGGVGLAAVQLCQARSCEIFATAGSETKREFLRSLGVRHIFDSRSLDFADEIRAATGCHGVDVVLNSLPGEAIPASLALLRPFGRFLEIGKTDIYQNRLLGLYPFQNNLSFSAIDLDRLLRERPQTVRAMFLELMEEFRQRRLQPLPHTVFPAQDVVGAFRYMQQRKNIGKVIVAVAREQGDSVDSRPPLADAAHKLCGGDARAIRGDGTYLITGGLGALGLQTARWLADQGARHLLLMGRGEPADSARQAIGEMAAQGITVRTVRADVAQLAQLQPALQQALDGSPPLRGVIHAAGVLEDAAVVRLERAQLARTLAPKLRGAWNLHLATLDAPLDWFVLFSSVAPLLGSPGQANYAAGNAFLDALAQHRRAAGLPALSINWGPWADSGMAARSAGAGQLAGNGIRPLPPQRAFEALEKLLLADRAAAPQVAVADVDWPVLGSRYPSGVPGLLADLVGQPAVAAGQRPLRAEILAAAAADRPALLQHYLREQLARVMELEPAQIDPRQPLSSLGIDSLMVIELKNLIESSLGVSLPIARFLDGPSVSQLVGHILEALAATAGPESPEPASASPANAAKDESLPGVAPLSYAQRALWLLHQLDPASTAYNVWDAVRFRGALDVERLRRALQKLVDRHPLLRTTFCLVDGEPRQRVHACWEVPLTVVEAAGWSDARQREFLQAEVHLPFDLERGPTARAVLLRVSASESTLVFVLHHIVTDLWSLLVAIGEVLQLYRAEAAGGEAGLPAPSATYRDFIEAEAALVAGPDGDRLFDYWRQELAGPLPVLDLPTDRRRPATQTYRGAVESLRVEGELVGAIKELGRERGTTVFMTLLAAYQVLLHRYTGQDDILVGSPTSGRSRAAFAEVMGDFINPVVIRGRLDGNPSFADFLESIRRKVLSAFDHDDYPFALLVERLQPPRDPSRPPIFQTLFVMRRVQNLAHGAGNALKGVNSLMSGEGAATLDMAGTDVQRVNIDAQHAQFDLACQVGEADGQLSIQWQYNTDLFDRETIVRLAGHFRNLLTAIVADPQMPVRDLPLASTVERDQLRSWNATACELPPYPTIRAWFEHQVAQSPNAVAIVAGAERVTYAELNRRANRLAAYLQAELPAADHSSASSMPEAASLKPARLVGIALERGPQMLVGLWAILKAGAAYVPLDPAFPPQRLAHMIADSGLAAIITQTSVRTTLEAALGCCSAEQPLPRVIDLDEAGPAIGAYTGDNLPPCVAEPAADGDERHAGSLAYVLYTSGSTGRPKGVEVTHRSVINFLQSMQRRPGLTADDCLLAVTTLSFDIAVLELLLPLVSGARVVLASRSDASDGAALARLLDVHAVSVLQATPATWRLLLAAGWRGRPGMKMLCGGEALPRELARGLLSRGEALWNMYGPTETTVWSTLDRVTDATGCLTIGRPIDNTQVHVLDNAGAQAPVGVVGELVIGGLGVARGYRGRPDLTAERFVPDPFSSAPGARMYRTGDLARYLADGRLECLGRADQQVKLRGFRIELGEIEAALCQHPTVREAAVKVAGGSSAGDARQSGADDAVLAAYVVCEPAAACHMSPPSAAELQAFLRLSLPDYMVPATIVALDSLPQTPNGKLDRARLPDPPTCVSNAASGSLADAEPRTATEREVARVWCDVLRVPAAGVHDDFFLSGGHSLRAAEFIARLRAVFPVDIPLRSLFAAPTIAGVARTIDALQAGQDAAALDEEVDFAAESQLDPAIRPAAQSVYAPAPPKAVLLTGATGYLGAFLLRELLDRTDARVYCLARAADGSAALQKLADNLASYELSTHNLAERVTPVVGDLAQPRFGLTLEAFDRLASEIDSIYHNGAAVNFVYPYRLLRGPNVLGTREVLRLAAQGHVKPVHFVSTFSVHASAMRTPRDVVTETDELPPCGTLHDGYSQTKWVAERLLAAGQQRGIPVAIYRPGRITGHSRSGAANTGDFLHAMLQGCLQLGAVPRLELEVDMTPVDYVSRAIVELSLLSESLGHAFHLVNPQPPRLEELVDWLQSTGHNVELVAFDAWRAQLLAAAEQPGADALQPLVQIFRPLGDAGDASSSLARVAHPRFDSRLTRRLLAAAGVCCPEVDARLLNVYFSHLAGCGFLAPLGRVDAAELPRPHVAEHSGNGSHGQHGPSSAAAFVPRPLAGG